MKKIALILTSLLIYSVSLAEKSDALKIVELLNYQLIPEVSDSSLTGEELEQAKAHRDEAKKKVDLIIASSLEAEMTLDELKQSFDFLSSKTGRKFYTAVNAPYDDDKLVKVMNDYYKKDQIQAE